MWLLLCPCVSSSASYKDPVIGFKATPIHEDLFSDPSLHHSCKEKSERVSRLRRVQLFATPWTAAHQAPPSMQILQARTLEWGAIAFSIVGTQSSPVHPISRVLGPRRPLSALESCAYPLRSRTTEDRAGTPPPGPSPSGGPCERLPRPVKRPSRIVLAAAAAPSNAMRDPCVPHAHG